VAAEVARRVEEAVRARVEEELRSERVQKMIAERVEEVRQPRACMERGRGGEERGAADAVGFVAA